MTGFAIKWVICSGALFMTGGLVWLGIRLFVKYKKKVYRKFFNVLWIDLKAKIGDDVILPTRIDETLKFYPALPKFDDCLKMPVKELIAKVSWTIDPNKHGLKTKKYSKAKG